jgi:predicted amidohydrolase
MTPIALVQQRPSADKSANVERGLLALETAAAAGAQIVCFPELTFEPFYPQCRAERGFEQLAELLPGRVRPPGPSSGGVAGKP